MTRGSEIKNTHTMKTKTHSAFRIPHSALAFLLAALPLRADLLLEITPSGTNALLTWTNSAASLEHSLTLTGAWTTVESAASPYAVPVTNEASFFRLRLPTGGPFDFRYLPPTFTTGLGDPAGCGCTSPENPNSLSTGGSAQDNGLGSVFLHTGELTQHAVDLSIPGRGLDWKFERRYRSGMQYDGPLGHGWDFNYNQRLSLQPNGDVLRVDGLGRVDRYVLTGGSYQSPSGFYTRLLRNLDGTFDERDRHGIADSYSATNTLGIARLTRIRDRNGNQMTFDYNPLGQLTNVVDTLGRSIAYSYDGNGRLTQVADFTGRTLQFTCDGDGNLATVTSPAVTGTPNGNDFPLGKTTRYTYSSGFGDARFNHNLLTVTAPNEVAASGPPRLVAQYDTNPASTNADRVVSLALGGTNASGVGAGGTITYAYAGLGTAPTTDFNTAVFATTVTNRNGNAGEYRFNQLGNIVRQIQFTRGLRPGDPAGYTNQVEFNRDGEITRHINPEGDSVENIYDSANSDRFQQGNLLQVRHLPGPRGGDQAQLLTSMTYETNFNFVATAADARGNTTTHTFDGAGNRIHATHRDPSIVEDFAYNGYGQILSHTLPDNGSGHRRLDTMSYYAGGPQTGYRQNRLEDNGGLNLTTTYEYDAVGNLTRAVDARGNNTLYTVNALNQIVRERSRAVDTTNGPVRCQRDSFYDANNNIVRVDTENRDDTGAIVAGNPAFTITYAYDILDDRLSTTQEVDATSSVGTGYAYDANQNRILVRYGEATAGRDPFNTVQTLYDERDLPFSEIRAQGSTGQSTTQSNYDRNGNLARASQGIEDLLTPRVTTYAYDGYNRRVAVTDAMGNVTTSSYDANGNIVAEMAAGELLDLPGSAGNMTLAQISYSYDAMDRLISRDRRFFDTLTGIDIGTGHAISRTVFSANSQVLTNFDANANATTTSYDSANRRGLVTDAKGNTVSYSYDGNNNVTAETQAERSDLGSPNQLFTTRYVYDALDRLISVRDNQTNTVQYAYDSRNNRTLATDPRGSQTRYSYDGLSRLLQTSRDLNGNGVFTDPQDITTTEVWDDSSRVTARSDGKGSTTRYAYDALNRPIATQMADGTVHQVGTGLVWNLGDTQPNLAGFTSGYDVHHNRVRTLDPNDTVMDVLYDLLNRVATNRVTVASFVRGTTNEVFRYDGLSRPTQVQDDGATVSRAYDSLGRMTSEMQQLAGGLLLTVAAVYDSVGNQTELHYPGGRWIVRGFDVLNRPAVVDDKFPGPVSPIATYSYVGPSRPERRQYGNGVATSWQYDGITGIANPANDFGVKSVIRITHTNAVTGGLIDDRKYVWDREGNQARFDDLLLPETRLYAYDANNRLTSSVFQSGNSTNVYNLDATGNRSTVLSNGVPGIYTCISTLPEPADCEVSQYTTTPFDSRTYDKNGNLATTLAPGGVLTTFTYDFHNRLIAVTNSTASVLASYQYDPLGRRVCKILNGAATVYGYDGTEEIEEQDAAGLTLATFVYSKGRASRLEREQDGMPAFYLEDVLGSTVALVDGHGAVLTRKRYADYGAALPVTVASTVFSQAPNVPLTFPSASGTNAHADNFNWNSPTAQITAINCWGVYPSGVHADNFTGVIYASSGLPGTQVAVFTVSGARVTRTLTGANIGGLPVYAYTLTLSPSLTLPPGSYWLALANGSSWNIVASSMGDNFSAKSTSVFGPSWNSDTPDMAFELVSSTTLTDSTGNHFEFGGRFFDNESGLYWCGDRNLATDLGRYIERNLSCIGASDLGNLFTFAGNNPTSAYPIGHDPEQPPVTPPPTPRPAPAPARAPTAGLIGETVTGTRWWERLWEKTHPPAVKPVPAPACTRTGGSAGGVVTGESWWDINAARLDAQIKAKNDCLTTTCDDSGGCTSPNKCMPCLGWAEHGAFTHENENWTWKPSTWKNTTTLTYTCDCCCDNPATVGKVGRLR